MEESWSFYSYAVPGQVLKIKEEVASRSHPRVIRVGQHTIVITA